jgi:hypothetical protein
MNCILVATQENLLISPSKVKEVSARTDLLQAALFIADSWRGVSTKTMHNYLRTGFKHSDLDVPNKADSENYVIMEMHHFDNYEEFHLSTVVCNITVKMKTVRKQLLNKLLRNTGRRQKIRKATESEQVTNQDDRQFTTTL